MARPALFALGFIALLTAAGAACTPQGCLSCDCAVNEDCISGERCDTTLGLCVAFCESHDECGDGTRCVFSTGQCTSADACTSNDHCTNFYVCDLANRLCERDACATDADCELEEAPRCDFDAQVCVAP